MRNRPEVYGRRFGPTRALLHPPGRKAVAEGAPLRLIFT